MANPVSILQAIIEFALKIKNEVDTFRHNKEVCRRISELVGTVRGVAEGLKRTTPSIMDDGALSDALKGLKQALERAWKLVAGFEKMNVFLRAVEADNIAEKLRQVCLDISLNLSAVVLANGAYNTSKLGNINEIVEALRANVAHNSLMLAKILEIVVPLPDAHLHLQREMAGLVHAYHSNSTDDAYFENKTTRETSKRGVSRYEICNEIYVTGPADDKGPFGYPYREGSGLANQSSQPGGAGGYSYSIVNSVPAHHGINQGIPYSNFVKNCEGTWSSSVVTVKDMNHLQEVLDMAKRDSKLLVLELMGSVNYTTTCEFMRPILEDRIVPEFRSSAYFYKLDVDNHKFKGLKTKWKVQALPDFVMVKNDKPVNRLVTADKDKLMTTISRSL